MHIQTIEPAQLGLYDQIPMLVQVHSEYRLDRVNHGLGGLLLVETPVEPYVKDLGKYAQMAELSQDFDLHNWGFWIAWDGPTPIAGAAVVCQTPNVHRLAGRTDLGVLWDIRVAESHRGQAV
jgi:hypothetical protein